MTWMIPQAVLSVSQASSFECERVVSWTRGKDLVDLASFSPEIPDRLQGIGSLARHLIQLCLWATRKPVFETAA